MVQSMVAPTRKKTGKRGRPPLKGDEQSNRNLILEAALVEFGTHGYEGTKIADIAERAGVVTPAVHYHFKTKDRLWQATMTRSFAELENQRAQTSDLQDLDDLSQLKVLTRRYIRFAFSRPNHARVIYLETLRDTDRARWLIDNHLTAIHKRDRELWGRLQDAGIIKPYPQLTFRSMMAGAVTVVITNVNAVGHLYDMESGDDLWKQQEDMIVDVLIDGFLNRD